MLKLEEFSRMFNINLKLLLHFEKENLLYPVHIRKENGVKYYTENLLYRIKKIISYQACGFKLQEIREIINLCFDEKDNEIKNEEIILKIIAIHNTRMLEDISYIWHDPELEEIQVAINKIENLIYLEL